MKPASQARPDVEHGLSAFRRALGSEDVGRINEGAMKLAARHFRRAADILDAPEPNAPESPSPEPVPLGQVIQDLLERVEALEAVAHEPVAIPIGNIQARLEALEKRMETKPLLEWTHEDILRQIARSLGVDYEDLMADLEEGRRADQAENPHTGGLRE